MNQIAPLHFASDPYFHDIIREVEAIEPTLRRDQGEDSHLGRRQFLKIVGAGAGLVLAF